MRFGIDVKTNVLAVFWRRYNTFPGSCSPHFPISVDHALALVLVLVLFSLCPWNVESVECGY